MVSEINLMRFSPNGECRQVSIDFISQVLEGKLYDTTTIASTVSNTDTLKFFIRNHYNILLKLTWINLLSPITWYQLLLFKKHITFNTRYYQQKLKLDLDGKNYAVLYYDTSSRLYCIEGEQWTHCVTGIKSNNTIFKIYDPLYECLKKDYPKIGESLTEIKLEKKARIKFLVWRSNK